MIKDVAGLIIADDRNIQLGELSKPRALSAMPYAGRYRIIDFMLSNMVNSGIRTVGVSTFNKYKSLMDHLGSGDAWDLDRKSQGLYFLTPGLFYDYLGMSDDLVGMVEFYRELKQKYVIVAGSNFVMSTTFVQLMQYHVEKKADITFVYNRDSAKEGEAGCILDMTRSGKVKTVYENPMSPVSNRGLINLMIMERELFVNILGEAVARNEKTWNFANFARLCDRFNVYAMEYKGLVLRINSIQEYFDATMALLDQKKNQELFWSGEPVYTKVKDEAPSFYSDGCIVENCIISDGCTIQGSVSNSMLFRGVTVSGQAKLKNCIILQDTYISEACELENVIIDKDCIIRPGTRLIGQEGYPVVIGKGAVV